jgi:hypothetical protein
MSSLTTTLINTINSTTNLTLQTGNSAAGKIVIGSGGEGFILTVNSVQNTVSINSTYMVANVAAVFSGNVSGATINATAFNLSGSSISTTGYSRLPNGLLMQWGTVVSNSSSGTITFPSNFAAAPYSVVLTPQANVGANSAGAVTATNTSAATVRTANATSYTFYYLALGV